MTEFAPRDCPHVLRFSSKTSETYMGKSRMEGSNRLGLQVSHKSMNSSRADRYPEVGLSQGFRSPEICSGHTIKPASSPIEPTWCGVPQAEQLALAVESVFGQEDDIAVVRLSRPCRHPQPAVPLKS